MTSARRKFRLTVLAGRLLVWAIPVAATAVDPAGGRFQGSIRVDLITVEVVVSDQASRPVSGLRRGDFRILEDGAEQLVTHFEEVTSRSVSEGETSSAAITRDVLVFVDLYHSGVVDGRRAVSGLRAALPDLLGPGVRVSIASYDGKLTVHVPLTTDRSEIEEALDRVETTYVRPVEPRAEGMSRRQVATLLQERIGWAEDAIEAAMRSVPRSDSRRVALVVTPGRTLDSDLRKLGPACTSLDCVSREGSWLASYGELREQGLLSTASHIATELGFTLFVVDPSDNSLSRSGRDLRSSLEEAAAATGGTARRLGDFAGAVVDIEQRTRSYYVLAFQAERPGDGRIHRIQVEVPGRPDVVLTHRSRYVDRPDEERRAAALLSDLLRGVVSQGLGATVTAGTPRRRTGFVGGVVHLASVPITARVPLRAVTLVPDGVVARGTILFVAYSNESWAQRSAVLKRAVPIEVPLADVARARRSHWTYTVELEVEAASPSLHVGVSDAVSGDSTTLELPLIHGADTVRAPAVPAK